MRGETHHADLLIRCELSQEVDVGDLATVIYHIPPDGCSHTRSKASDTSQAAMPWAQDRQGLTDEATDEAG